ncbi:MAG: NfeD family protein [Clostridiales bacterium]|nr:NfeD family protein [Clostridiales bacterium]
MEFIDVIAAFAWLALAIVLVIAEAATVQLVSIWFAAGALAAMIPAMIGLDFTAQLAMFALVSVLLLAITRPLVKKKLAVRRVETNARAVVGMLGKVTTEIDNAKSQGRVSVDDMDWSARSEDGSIIPAGDEVLVKEIQGVKLIVERIY